VADGRIPVIEQIARIWAFCARVAWARGSLACFLGVPPGACGRLG